MLSLSVKLTLAGVVLLGAAVALETHRRAIVTRERARYGLLRDDVEMFMDALATSLRNPESCLGVLGRRTLSPGQTQNAELDYAFATDQKTPLAAGAEPWAGTIMRTLTLTLPGEPDQRTTFRNKEYRRFRARLEAEFIVPDRFPRGVPGRHDFFVWLTANDQVASCFGSLSVGSVCNMTGGYYDVDAPADRPRCHQVLKTIVGSAEKPVFRGSCRVRAFTGGGGCPAGEALRFQDKVGFNTRAHALCRVCE